MGRVCKDTIKCLPEGIYFRGDGQNGPFAKCQSASFPNDPFLLKASILKVVVTTEMETNLEFNNTDLVLLALITLWPFSECPSLSAQTANGRIQH